MPKARRKHWWAIVAQRTLKAKTYHTLNMVGKRDRPVVVTSTDRGEKGIAYFCVSCVSNECAHCLFVRDVISPAEPPVTTATRRLSLETPPQETRHGMPGPHFGKMLKDLPRDVLLSTRMYHTNPKRSWGKRSQEIVANIDATLNYLDAQRSTDFEAFPEALLDDPHERMPWEQ